MSERRHIAPGTSLFAVSSTLLAVALALSGCGTSEERLSEIQLHEAIERLRSDKSIGTERALKISFVARLTPHTPEGHAAQDACVSAYTDLQHAEDAIFFAELRMKQAQAAKFVPPDIVSDVAAAEALLQKAKKEMPACEAAAAKLALVAR